ncbi:MAG: exosortase-associated EpsI family protein [Chloroflexi bacterium]|nr:exosortase-associated EpsI family protein [Chloroflexota bacterium]
MQNAPVRTIVAFLLLLAGAVFVNVPWQTLFKAAPTLSSVDSYAYVSDLTIWRRTKGEHALATDVAFDLDHDLHNVPLSVGDWQGKEVPQTNISVLIMLEPEQFVERLYRNSQGQYLWLTLIGGRQSRTFHPPEVCYDAFDWQTQLSYQTIPLLDGEIQGTFVNAVKDEQTNQLSFYFYLFLHHDRNPEDGIVMVRVTSPRYGNNVETLKLYSEFLSHFFSGAEPSKNPSRFQSPASSLMAGGLKFEGHSLSDTVITSNSVLGIDFAWSVVEPPTAVYRYDLWLAGPDGLIWSDKQTERSHLFKEPPPTNLWKSGQQIQDSREIALLSGAPPGQYDIVLTLFQDDTLQPLTFVEETGRTLGPHPVIGQVAVTTPNEPAQFQPQFSLERPVSGAGLTLIGYNQDRVEASPGESLLLTLFWEKTAPRPQTPELVLQLRSLTGATAHAWTIPPVRADYPPPQWQLGERLRGQHLLRLPTELAGGNYQFQLNDVPLGSLTINAPDRIFVEPAYETAVAAIFSNQIELVGYTVNSSKSITLIWRAASELPVSYHVFVHLLDEAGQIITQSDGVPAHWTRPTTGWLSGEYIVDPHTLTLPDGIAPAAIRVGLYNADTGQRLTTTNGGDYISLSLPSPLE